MTEDEVAQMYSVYGYFLFRRCLAFLGDATAADDALTVDQYEVWAQAHPKTWSSS